MQPSAYQQDIMNWLTLEDGNAIIDAKAGSGKTSTLVMLADLIDRADRSVFIAFNKSIATELKLRLPAHVESATFHALCYRALRLIMPASRSQSFVQANKMHNILDDMVAENGRINPARNGIVRLVALMKANMLLPNASDDDITELIAAHDIDFDIDEQWVTMPNVLEWAREALTRSNNDTTCIDFDDQLYLAAIKNAPIQKHRYVFVDEAQDLNKVQRYLLTRMLGATGRLIAVGDNSQAIYGFRGAGADSMEQIRSAFNCTVLPLSISYRCPASVVRLAQSIVPNIEARPNAPEGTVATLDTWTLPDFNSTDLVVCRNTAPLVTLAFKFVRAHLPVKVMGRDIGLGLIALIKKMRATTLEELDERLQEYARREVDKALAKRQDARAQRIMDQCDSIVAMCEGMPESERTVYALVAKVQELFTDATSNTGRTTLATVHKAKGMEATRVFILDPHLMPSKFARLPWQQVQEQNLRYVAITRALDTLYFIKSERIA